jgi:hypothetical protein
MSFQVFGTGFVLMILCIAIGILMSFAGGTLIDTMTTGETGEMFVNNSGVSPAFQEAQDGTIFWFINLYYFLCYAIPMLGVAIFIQSILPRTTGDRLT